MCKKETYILYPVILNLIVSIDQEYLWEVLNYVWEDGLTELEVQEKILFHIRKRIKGEDRLYLETVYKTIEELELKDSLPMCQKMKIHHQIALLKNERFKTEN